ncbi:MAG: chemotaxis protein CheW [Xenococcaceae cyanobacterium MO_207.B15]|nr:chemotaxis protein CheW [Xenococcaceae cyanobacterium MO_207.B15]
MNQEYFNVGLSESIYLGLPLDSIDKLIHLESDNICVIPGVASFWAGVFNYRGSLVWILDSQFLTVASLAERMPKKQTLLVLKPQIQEGQKKQVALIVKKLAGILTIDRKQCKSWSATSALSSLGGKICPTVAEEENKQIYLLDTDILFEQIYQNSLLSA